jgi:hypothetical protein
VTPKNPRHGKFLIKLSQGDGNEGERMDGEEEGRKRASDGAQYELEM